MKSLKNVPRQIRKATKKTTSHLTPKNVETNSPSNAEALDLEEEILLKPALPKIKRERKNSYTED